MKTELFDDDIRKQISTHASWNDKNLVEISLKKLQSEVVQRKLFFFTESVKIASIMRSRLDTQSVSALFGFSIFYVHGVSKIFVSP